MDRGHLPGWPPIHPGGIGRSCRSDGANRWERFTKIMLPMMRGHPGLLAGGPGDRGLNAYVPIPVDHPW